MNNFDFTYIYIYRNAWEQHKNKIRNTKIYYSFFIEFFSTLFSHFYSKTSWQNNLWYIDIYKYDGKKTWNNTNDHFLSFSGWIKKQTEKKE